MVNHPLPLWSTPFQVSTREILILSNKEFSNKYMKRPLCLMAILLTAIVYVYLEFFVSDYLKNPSEFTNDNQVQVIGIVERKEFRKDFEGDKALVIYLSPVNGNFGKNKYIQCYMSKEDAVEPCIGQYVKVSGKYKCFSSARNPGEFDSRLYYSTLKISYRIKNASIIATAGRTDFLKENLYRIRYHLEEVLDRNLNEDDAAIMKAVLLGDKAFMDDEVKELYQSAGIIHILAVSGLHISILGMGIYKLLRKLRLKSAPASVIAVAFMILYGMMCGMGASSARAIAMFAIRMMAPIIERTYDILSSLAVIEIMMILEQPLYLYNSGFLFSFGAIVGIAFVMPALGFSFEKEELAKMHFADDPEPSVLEKIKMYVISGIKVSISILLVTLPVYMSFFYTYPIYSIFLNLLVLPLMPILMIVGIICLLIGNLYAGNLILPGTLIHVILSWYSEICSIVSMLPGRNIYLGHTTKIQIVIYYLILMFFVYSKEIKIPVFDLKKIKTTRYLFPVMGIIIILFRPSVDLKISMIDIGQGDCLVLSTRGEHIMIDGGSTDRKEVGKYSIIPYLKYEGIGSLDKVIITHEDEDHISGILEIMDDMEKGGIRIKQLILPEVAEESRGDNYHEIENRARSLGVPIAYINSGEKFNAGEVSFTCLNPEINMVSDGANEYSTVLFMEYPFDNRKKELRFTALFTGDVEGAGQEYIKRLIRNNPEKYANVSILKVAHHGSKYTTDEEFLNLVNPKVALISCGIDNSYGHPHQELLDRLNQIGTTVYRTDISGYICVTTNGQYSKTIP